MSGYNEYTLVFLEKPPAELLSGEQLRFIREEVLERTPVDPKIGLKVHHLFSGLKDSLHQWAENIEYWEVFDVSYHSKKCGCPNASRTVIVLVPAKDYFNATTKRLEEVCRKQSV